MSLYTYVDGLLTGRLYTYDVDSLTIRDSMPIGPFEVFSTPNPSEVILQIYDPASGETSSRVSVINKRSGTEREVCRGVRRITALKAGGLMAQDSLNGYDVTIHDVETGAVVRTIRGGWAFGESDSKGCEFAYIELGDPQRNFDDTALQLLDVCSDNHLGTFIPRLPDGSAVVVNYFKLHADGRRVLLLGLSKSGGGVFLLGDMISGQTLMFSPLENANGQAAVSADGRLAAVSDPGDFFTGGPRYIDVFDLETMSRLARVDQTAGLVRRSTGQLLFLPGSRLLSAPDNSLGHSGPLTVIDLTSFTVTDTIDLPFTNASIGVWPGVYAIALGEELD